ncbi:acyl-CoA carboxylase subunit epsilon [Pilimelia anulata]|uniref:acyl-CoA carboxylase subunit epsilon n=1 Tax=Pilimelia anulata TaxID=53371 RepID=UPI001E4889A4|nr:acyl-CoA carboxylase subunit epsilon [Pilimelia anulata]
MTEQDRPDPDRSLRIVRGTPTPAEVAALVGVLITRAAPAPAPPAARSAWAASARPRPARGGPGGWRRSGRPQ